MEIVKSKGFYGTQYVGYKFFRDNFGALFYKPRRNTKKLISILSGNLKINKIEQHGSHYFFFGTFKGKEFEWLHICDLTTYLNRSGSIRKGCLGRRLIREYLFLQTQK